MPRWKISWQSTTGHCLWPCALQIFHQLLSWVCVCVLSHFSSVLLFQTLWTVDCQALLSMGFSRQEHWSELPCPPPVSNTKLFLIWSMKRNPKRILKEDAVKVLHSIYQQIWKTQQWPQDWKRCFHFNPKERQCQRTLKLPHNCTHLTCQQSNAQNSPSLQQYVNWELPDVQVDLEKAEEPEIKFPASVGS